MTYSRRGCDLDFQKILRPVIDTWIHKDGPGLSEVVKHLQLTMAVEKAGAL